jgi:hypothetical protein
LKLLNFLTPLNPFSSRVSIRCTWSGWRIWYTIWWCIGNFFVYLNTILRLFFFQYLFYIKCMPSSLIWNVSQNIQALLVPFHSAWVLNWFWCMLICTLFNWVHLVGYKFVGWLFVVNLPCACWKNIVYLKEYCMQ